MAEAALSAALTSTTLTSPDGTSIGVESCGAGPPFATATDPGGTAEALHRYLTAVN